MRNKATATTTSPTKKMNKQNEKYGVSIFSDKECYGCISSIFRWIKWNEAVWDEVKEIMQFFSLRDAKLYYLQCGNHANSWNKVSKILLMHCKLHIYFNLNDFSSSHSFSLSPSHSVCVSVAFFSRWLKIASNITVYLLSAQKCHGVSFRHCSLLFCVINI